MTEKTTFYYTTFKITGSVSLGVDRTATRDEIIRESLLEYIKSDEAVIETDNGDWYFGSYKDYEDYVIGKFGKVYSDEPVTYDKELGDFVEGLQPNIDADYSMFILHFEKDLLIFNTTYRVRHKNFVKYFTKGYNINSKGSLEIEIDYLYNREDIDTIVEKFPVINAEFELEPSNPHSEDAWEELDDHIQNMLARKLDIDVDSLEGNSLNFDDEALNQMLQMSKTEYGKSELVYNDNGQIKVASSDEEEPVQTKMEEPEGIGGLRDSASDLIEFASSFIGNDS